MFSDLKAADEPAGHRTLAGVRLGMEADWAMDMGWVLKRDKG
jgi:hypothetical protein